MSDSLSWLPSLIGCDPWTENTFDDLYDEFCKIFDPPLMYEGQPVRVFPNKEDGHETVFWHITHRDDKESGVRLPDLRRCERLSWIRPMIENADDAAVLAWDHVDAKRVTKTYVWLQPENFVVILKRNKNGRRWLLAAFFVDQRHTRKKLRKKYDQRVT